MSDKPWADPGLSIEERARCVVEYLSGLTPSGAQLVAEAMRATRDDALEEAAALLEEVSGGVSSPATAAALREVAFSVRGLRGRAPAA